MSAKEVERPTRRDALFIYADAIGNAFIEVIKLFLNSDRILYNEHPD